MAHDEPVDIPGNQRLKGHGPRPETLGEERVNGGKIVDGRRRTQAALLEEEALVGAFDPRDRVATVCAFGSVWDPALAAQVAQQLPSRRRFALWRPSRSSRAQKRLETPLVQRLGAKPLVPEPEAEVPHKPKLVAGRLAGVSLRREVGGESIEIAGQGSNPQPTLAP